ncbi:membrane protein insertase YidC [Corynebacterium choanae]|uniref:Membrane protein insertase YidC n=1 Tax=Corynebacterium choanae TaxID=1862358 RepID=A0A3G6J3K5_9CORY|nr:membrane protein insertase YidC [Corynebacterium choanae]AZA12506.1 Membrane protein insertase MisCB precursor [Corynebacterium choanae]
MIWDAVIYPVSGIMKLVFLGLHHGLGLDESHAWIGSIFGLILVVRGFIAPLAYMQYKNNRIMTNLRPRLHELSQANRMSFDPTADKQVSDARKALYKEHHYSMAKGCWPALIQMPVFLGLYRLLLLMARPADGLEAAHHAPIGMLTSEDVSGFIQARVHEVPTVAYIAMSQEQLDYLQTSYDDVHGLLLPLFILAATFTTINMAYSVWRNRITLDHDSNVSVWSYRILILFVPLVPVFTLNFGLHGPAPAAIALYWFANNLWTMTQFIVLNKYLDRIMPFTDEFVHFREERKHEVRRRTTLRKQFARRRRLRRLQQLVMPWKIREIQHRILTDRDATMTAIDPDLVRVTKIRARRRELTKELQKQKNKLAHLQKQAKREQQEWPPQELVERGLVLANGELNEERFIPDEEDVAFELAKIDAALAGEPVPADPRRAAGDEDAATAAADEPQLREAAEPSLEFEWIDSYPVYPSSGHSSRD